MRFIRGMEMPELAECPPDSLYPCPTDADAAQAVLKEVAAHFGYKDTMEYLDAIEHEGANILRRLPGVR